MFAWLTQSKIGIFLATFFLSMVPVAELRAGLPYGIAHGLNYSAALAAALLGNLLPVPFIILFVRRIFAWLRQKNCRLDDWISGLERKAHMKGDVVRKYGPVGLCLLVAIPLPGTGAWTGALVAAILNLRMRQALPAIILGLLIAAVIVSALVLGVTYVF